MDIYTNSWKLYYQSIQCWDKQLDSFSSIFFFKWIPIGTLILNNFDKYLKFDNPFYVGQNIQGSGFIGYCMNLQYLE